MIWDSIQVIRMPGTLQANSDHPWPELWQATSHPARARGFPVAQGRQPAVLSAGTPLAAEGTGKGRVWKGKRTMTEHVWYIQGAHFPETLRSYVPDPEPALDAKANRERRSRVNYRAKTGAPVAPEELPEQYEHDRAGRDTKLDVAIWNSAFVHLREDVAEVIRAFDPGATTIRPIKIALGGKQGVDTRCIVLLTSNIRPTIDPDNSEPI
jgi:hypothetical protein